MEFPIFSFLTSLFSIITNNNTDNTRSSANYVNDSPIIPKHIILTIVQPPPILPTTVSTTISTTTPSQFSDLVILCPHLANSSDFNLLLKTRFHNQTKKCYTVPSQGPCGNNMAFFAEDDLFGECGCKIDNRLLIYNKKQNQCFYIFQRAYCNKLQWLDITRNGTPICTRNSCINFFHGQKDMVRHGGRCVEVGSGCPDGEIVGFQMFRRLPTCVHPRSVLALPRSIGVPLTPCNLGSLRAIGGRCNPPFDFD